MSEKTNVFVINPYQLKQINVRSHDLFNIHFRAYNNVNLKCSELTYFFETHN